jgi:DNA polymerase-3 subunit epsilon
MDGARLLKFRERAGTFVAIDFETADRWLDSACAVGLVRVEGWRIVRAESFLIRPPRRQFFFSYLHGITWNMVKDRASFAEAWPALGGWFDGAEFLAAHNASFDRSVLRTCCDAARLTPPALPFECTMRLARKVWGIHPTRLPDVCARLGVPLRHHDPLSDAEACARILIEARRAGG